MRMLRPKVLVEFVGGPADGVQIRVPIEPDTKTPVARRVFSDIDGQTYAYDLRPRPDGNSPWWLYVYRPDVVVKEPSA